MNKYLALLLVAVASTGVLAADDEPHALADMSELMTRIIQPTSDAVFYISRFPPEDDAAWRELENKTLMLAESANLLLIPGYKRSTEQWLQDTLLMRDASVRAWQAAKDQDTEALIDLNNDLYTSCESCHTATR
jgi:hypothetical protein